MPDDLSGDLSENQWLVSRFVEDLSPHHVFWKELSEVVHLAFPKDSLSKSGSLERKVHQFRYVISSQQAQYVRKYYKKKGMTDAQALSAYLGQRHPFSYSFNQSARLHNKVAIIDGGKRYPGGKESFNIKVLLARFHTEFILSSDGRFLNELDVEAMTEEGIVNGASFNYGWQSRHWSLDVRPVGPHDPNFRKMLTRRFQSPKKSKKRYGRKLPRDYEHSYFNQSGLYSKDGRSQFTWVKEESRQLKRQVRSRTHGQKWLKGLKNIGQHLFSKHKKGKLR